MFKTKPKLKEKRIQSRLKKELKAEIEVETPVGRIDLLSDRELIEIKHGKQWKYALGQFLAYAAYYPSHIKRIHLFGLVNQQKTADIVIVCGLHNVDVTFENG